MTKSTAAKIVKIVHIVFLLYCQSQSSKRKLHGSILGVCEPHWPFLLPSIARSLPLGLLLLLWVWKIFKASSIAGMRVRATHGNEMFQATFSGTSVPCECDVN